MRPTLILLALFASTTALADEVTYRNDIRPLWQEKCIVCHGEAAPSLLNSTRTRKSTSSCRKDRA